MPASFALPFVKRICRRTGSLIAFGILTARLASPGTDGRAFAQEATDTATPQPSPSAAEPTAMNVIVQDHFEGEDGLITSHEHCATAEFPFSGTSLPSNPSPIWEGDSGYFHRRSGWGYSGHPADWKDRYFFRMSTRNFNIQDAAISWRYRSARAGENGYPSESSDAVDVWLRYQTQYNLYVFQFDRADNGFQAKRKLPAQGWTGPPELIANKGVYYTLPTDEAQPIFAAGQHLVTWNGIKNLLPASEKAKPNFPNLAHDSTTTYDFKVTVKNVGDKVQIQAYRAGVRIYSATDDGRSAIAANGETQGQHLDWGYYETVPGWKPSWGSPITHAGASGFRSDDIEFWITDFVISKLN